MIPFVSCNENSLVFRISLHLYVEEHEQTQKVKKIMLLWQPSSFFYNEYMCMVYYDLHGDDNDG